MDGPPFVTGKLHMGHLAIGSIKSAYLNYKHMMGYKCNNKLGYDCHGVPIESIANRELDIKSIDELENIGIKKFNAFCKETITKFEKDWEPVYNKMGRWTNFDDVYKTMDLNFMESIWWGFGELYNKGLIYRGYKVVAYSYPLQSPLSNSEESQNYKDVNTKTIYVRFKVVGLDNTYLVAWTTTPWTLIANVALCVNKNLEYEYVLVNNTDGSESVYIVGKNTHKNCGLKVKNIIKTVKGSELVGLKYNSLYNFYDNIDNGNFFQVVEDNYVQESGTSGTNIVHLAPTFGEDDYRVCKKNLINDDIIRSLDPIDVNCKYISRVDKYAGILVFDAEPQIIQDLKSLGHVIKIQQISHQYPYCYRTETPLIYRTCESFYVNVQKIKERMIELNANINWSPSNIGSGRFNLWLENARDWCISRSRYFGTPIPVWISDKNNILVIKSIDDLYKYSGVKVNDLHPEFINDITFDYEGEYYIRVKDVFDCWFESGCVPFAQHHYPFENNNIFDDKNSLSEFIVEGIDQTRGWFYSLLVLSTALFDKKPAENIMVVGHVLGENGKKISKKDGNFIDPTILIDQYGADAIRLYLLQSPLTNAEPFAFKDLELHDIKQVLYRFKNAHEFLKEHTHNQKLKNIIFDKDCWKQATNPMDCWIISYVNNIGNQVIKLMDSYQIAKAVRLVIDLVDDITNWYIKFNRDRMKGKCGNQDWIMSTSVLNYILQTFGKMLTPFAPFITTLMFGEEILNSEYTFEVFSQYDKYITTFELLKRIAKIVRAARMGTKTHNSIKTPIKACTIYTDNKDHIDMIRDTIDYIQSELNILDISYKQLTGSINYKIIPNKSIIGKKYRNDSKKIVTYLESLTLQDKIYKDLDVNIGDNKYIITCDEYTLEPIFNNNDYFDRDIMTQIDFTYDQNIQDIYNIKSFITSIQLERKNMGLHVWDKISIEIVQDNFNIVEKHLSYMQERLECEVNLNSKYSADKYYSNDDDKKISYCIVRK
jgi:isoleucyl-tRNA synthetase